MLIVCTVAIAERNYKTKTTIISEDTYMLLYMM